MSKYIVKQNIMGNEFIIFDLECQANKGFLNCISLESGNYTSWSEASYGYYLFLKPCKNKDVLECIKRDFKKMYNDTMELRQKITQKDRLNIWK